MYYITIPLEENCYNFLGRADFYHRITDTEGLCIGSIVRDECRYTDTHETRMTGKTYRRAKKLPTGYNRKFYPCEIRMWFGNQFADRINRITEHTVVAVNSIIRRWIREEFIIYIRRQRREFPDRMNKDHIYYFCEDYGLMPNDTFFETLKKYEYRKRQKKSDDSQRHLPNVYSRRK